MGSSLRQSKIVDNGNGEKSSLDHMIDDATWHMNGKEREDFLLRLRTDPEYFSQVSRQYTARLDAKHKARISLIDYWTNKGVLIALVLAVAIGLLSAL